jgi:hypothetical protein
MAYGIIKVDNITFDNGGSDQNVTVSGLYRATTSGVTVSGTIAATTVSGVTVIGSTTVSGATVTGTTANFTSGNFGNIISSAATMSGALIIANQQQVQFREAVGNGVNYIALQAPAIISADQTITLPDQTGTVVTTGDDGSVTSTMILDGTILNVDINASAAIAGTKISPDFGSQTIVTTGVHSAAVGSATTPSITFTGDLNTGIYSPGADQLAISTNGTGRLFVDASGNVGVGTGSPVTALQVVGVGTFGNNVGGRLQVTTDSNLGYIDSLNNTSTQWQPLIERGTEIQFHTNTAGVTPTQKAVIDSSGRLGLGTSSPNALLDVNAGSAWVGSHYVSTLNTDYRIRLRSVGAATNNNYTVELGASGSGPQPADSDLTINTQTWNGSAYVITEKMRVTATGNVGIGTTGPAGKLHVAGDSILGDDGTKGRLTIDSTTSAVRLYATTTGFGNYEDLALFADNHIFNIGTTERARIDSSGRLLVGTSSARSNVYYTTVATTPSVQFESVGSAYNGLSLINYSASGFSPVLTLGLSASNTQGTNTAIASTHELGAINFTGNDGTNFRTGASIVATNDQLSAWAVGDCPTRLVFSVTADGAASPTEALRISNDRSITVSDGGNVVLGTTTGTKIGTATTQKIGFYNATPVVQPTAVADATDAASVITQLNALLTRMRNLGLIAT